MVSLDAPAVEALWHSPHLLSGSVHVDSEAGRIRSQAQYKPASTQRPAHDVQVQKPGIELVSHASIHFYSQGNALQIIRLRFQVTSKVMHYFWIYKKISKWLFQINNVSYFFPFIDQQH